MSTDKQEDSIERQRKQVEPYAAREGYRIVVTHEDHGIAGDEFDRRPGLQRLLKDAKAGKLKTILVDELSRLSRQDYIDFITTVVKPLRDCGVNVVSVAEGPQSWDNVVGIIQTAVHQDKNTSEVKKMSRRVLGGMLKKAAAGGWMGGSVPYGLAVAGTGKGRRYAPGDPDRAAAVRMIFERCAACHTLRGIARELIDRAIPDPSGKLLWHPNTICKILRNRKYVGDNTWNTRHCGKYHGCRNGDIVENGNGPRTDRPNPKEHWVIAPDTHEGLVSRELFEKCQERLAENQKHTTPIRDGGPFLLTGLLVCGHCGYRLVGHTHKARGKRYYRCGHYKRAGRRACLAYNIREDKLLAAIVGRLRAAVLNKDNLDKLREELRRQLDEERRQAPAKEAALRKRLKTAAAKIDKALDRMAFIDPELLPDYSARIKSWKEDKAKLEAELDAVLHPPVRMQLEEAVKAAEGQLELLERNLDKGDPALVRETIREIITKVEVWFEADRPGGRRNERYTFQRGRIYFRPQEELDLSCLLTAACPGEGPRVERPRSVAEWMADRGIRLEELVGSAGLDAKVVRAVVEGRYTPSPQQRQRLAAVLGVEPARVTWGHTIPVQHIQGHGPQFGRSP
jgi:site-specific DNA recombinase